jgi:hypothetical protein
MVIEFVIVDRREVIALRSKKNQRTRTLIIVNDENPRSKELDLRP